MKVIRPIRVSQLWFCAWRNCYELRCIIARPDGAFEHHYRLCRGVCRNLPKLVYFISWRGERLY